MSDFLPLMPTAIRLYGVKDGEGSVLLGFDVSSLHNRFPTFRRDVLPSSSAVYVSFFTELYCSEDEVIISFDTSGIVYPVMYQRAP